MGIFNKRNNMTPEQWLQEIRKWYPNGGNTHSNGIMQGELNLAVDNAVSRISNTVSILPLTLQVWTKNGQMEAWNHPVARLLKDPSPEESAQSFYKTVIRQMLLRGNCYIFKHKVNGEVVALEVIDPARIPGDGVYREPPTFKKFFRVTGGDQTLYTEDDIIQLYYPEEGYNSTRGRSPVDVHRPTIIRNDLIASYIDIFFQSGLNSRLLVELGDEFKPGNPKMEKIMAEFQQFFYSYVLGYANAGKPVITPPGTKINKLEMSSNVQSDVFNLYKQSCNEIYRMFNVPPEVIDSSESKYGSLEQKQQDFLVACIRPLCLHICQLLQKSLLKPHEQGMYEICYNYDAMLEVDSNSKIEYLMKLYHGGLITLNEFRQKMHMSSISNEIEGNTRLVPANLIPWTEDNVKAILAKSKLALVEAEEKQLNHNPINDKLE